MSDAEKPDGKSHGFPHDLFILTGEVGADGSKKAALPVYRHLDEEYLKAAPAWLFGAEEQKKTDQWLKSLWGNGSILAIHPEPTVERTPGGTDGDYVDAVLCMMLNYAAVSEVVDKVAEEAFQLGKQAAQAESSESSKS